MTVFLIFLVVSLTIISGFLSLSQIALFSLSSTEIKVYRTSTDPRKQLIATLLSRPRDLLVTLLMSDIAANILVQNSAASLFGEQASWWYKVGVPLALTLLIGEVFPKTLALPNKKKISYAVAPFIDRLVRFLGPIRVITTTITAQLSRFLFFFLRKEKEISPEELHHVLRTSERHGILTREEAEIIDGYLALEDYSIRERMRPRDEIYFYELSEPLSKLIFLFSEKGCTRIPVCLGDLQNLQGILTARAFFLHRNHINDPKDLLNYLVKPVYVPETISSRTLLKQFLKNDKKMAIVVDEYGSISGLITQEDLIELVIGEIIDERDEKIRYTPAGKDVIITSGKFELNEFEELFGVVLPSESNVVTLGGWLTEQLGDIPKSGTKYVWKDFLFQVLSADPNRVRRIYVRRIKGKTDG